MDFRLTIPGKDELWELPHDRRWQVRRGGQVAGFRRGTQGRWCCTGRCTEFGTDRDGRCSDFLRSRSSGSPTFQGLQTVASRVHFREQYRALVGHALVWARVLLLLRALSVPGDTV